MDIRHLRCAVAAADELHFSRAAQRLGLSKAAMSTAVREVEKETGRTLFERTSRTVRLTSAGAEFARRARLVLQEFDELQTDLDEGTGFDVETVRMGFVATATHSVLPGALRIMRLQHPDVDVVLEPLSSSRQLDLLTNHLHLGLVRGPVGAFDVPTEEVAKEDLLACMSSEVAVAHADDVSPDLLAQMKMVMVSSGEEPGFFSETRSVFDGHRLPATSHRVGSHDDALAVVATGRAFTLIPSSLRPAVPISAVALPITTRPTTELRLAHASPLGAAGRLILNAMRNSAGASGRPN